MTLPTDPVVWANKAFNDGRNEIIDKYQEYLEGKHPVAFATDKFRKTFGRTFDSFAYNRLESVVSAYTDGLQVSGLSSDDPGLAADAQMQWDDNRMDVRENESTTDALGYGDGFLVVEADPNVNGRVHYWVNDPRNIRVHYSDEVPGELDLAAKRWVAEDGYARLNLYYVDKVDKYISRNKAQGGIITSTANADIWNYLEDESFALTVTDTVPVFHLGNNARTNGYGTSEIKLLIPLQDAMNFVLMTSMVATEFAAFSQKVMMGVQPENAEEEAQMARFESGVDRIMMLFDENAKIGEFSAADLSKYIELAEFWDRTISAVSRVPMRWLKAGGAAESGEAKRMDEAPFTAKKEDRQRSFGYTYSEAVRYGLRLTGKDVPPGAIRVNWVSAAPHSEADTWALVETKVRSGLPFMAALREAGYDTDQIGTIMKEYEMERVQAQRYLDRGAVDVSFGAEGESA